MNFMLWACDIASTPRCQVHGDVRMLFLLHERLLFSWTDASGMAALGTAHGQKRMLTGGAQRLNGIDSATATPIVDYVERDGRF